MLQKTPLFLITVLSMLVLACGSGNADKSKKELEKNTQKPTLVSVATIKSQPIEITETSVGSLEGLNNPTVSAEVAARVVSIHVNAGQSVKQGQLIATLDATDFALQRNEAQAEVARLQALLSNQAKTVERNLALVGKKFISQNVVDNDIAQANVLKEQLSGAQARISSINHSSSKTKIYAPASGKIEKKIVDDGEFVKVGDPIVQIVSSQRLRAHLPFPEHIGATLKPGLKVRLNTPTSDKTIEVSIHELKPMITEGSRTVDVIADIVDAPGWQAGASVTGVVVLGTQPTAMMVPEQSLVLRPAGDVVYIMRDNKAYQAIVKTGMRQNGLVEIRSGIRENDKVIVDGAGFLTDKALVKLSTSPAPAHAKQAKN